MDKKKSMEFDERSRALFGKFIIYFRKEVTHDQAAKFIQEFVKLVEVIEENARVYTQ